jgi:tRNA modification GTPase
MIASSTTTIAAPATASGRAGIAVVRLSGPMAYDIAIKITKSDLPPRSLDMVRFYDLGSEEIDHGLGVFFKGPKSYTGEDVVEIHCHGSPIIVDQIMEVILAYGGVLAEPGEFTKRAFLNGKLNLFQAEAVADIIDAATVKASRSALRSLEGHFSKEINEVISSLTKLRVLIESGLDFAEEDIDFISNANIIAEIETILGMLDGLKAKAKVGKIMQEGMKIVIFGPPNAGKSSLFNYLSLAEEAIVTDIPGTTRDVLKQKIKLDDSGFVATIYDTAGIRPCDNVIEKIGIERARSELESSDCIIVLLDAACYSVGDFGDFVATNLPEHQQKALYVLNKTDLVGGADKILQELEEKIVPISIKDQLGRQQLVAAIKSMCKIDDTESVFTARQRHITAIDQGISQLIEAKDQCLAGSGHEIVAEHLRFALNNLGHITGAAVASDDILGEIFSSFCIGK